MTKLMSRRCSGWWVDGGCQPTSGDAEIVPSWGNKPAGSVIRRRNSHRTRTVAWDIVNQ